MLLFLLKPQPTTGGSANQLVNSGKLCRVEPWAVQSLQASLPVLEDSNTLPAALGAVLGCLCCSRQLRKTLCRWSRVCLHLFDCRLGLQSSCCLSDWHLYKLSCTRTSWSKPSQWRSWRRAKSVFHLSLPSRPWRSSVIVSCSHGLGLCTVAEAFLGLSCAL